MYFFVSLFSDVIRASLNGDPYYITVSGGIAGLLMTVGFLMAIVGFSALLGGAYTTITVWTLNKVRGPRSQASPATSTPQRAALAHEALPPPAPAQFSPLPRPGSLTLYQRLTELDQAWHAGLISEQEFMSRRTEILSQS